MVYWGPSGRVSSVNHFVKALQDTTNTTGSTMTLNAQERTYEFAMVFGNRFVRTFKQSSMTFELYAGGGIGYRYFRKNYDHTNEYYDSLFLPVSQNKWFIPVRLGFSVGYFFR